MTNPELANERGKETFDHMINVVMTLAGDSREADDNKLWQIAFEYAQGWYEAYPAVRPDPDKLDTSMRRFMFRVLATGYPINSPAQERLLADAVAEISSLVVSEPVAHD